MINGYWNHSADVFKTTRPLTAFGDHTQTLKYIDFDLVLGADGVKLLQAKSFLLPMFFHYQLQAFTLKSLGYARHYRLLKDKQVVYPSLPEQERIVAILDEAFERIGTALANTETSRNSVSQLAHAGGFPTEPIIGKKCYTLGDLCEFIVDCEHKTAPIQKEGTPSIRTPNIGKGILMLDGVIRVSEETYRLWTRRAEPREGDLIFAREAPAGNVAVVPPDTRLCLGQRTVLLRPKRKVVDPSFLVQLILHPATQQRWLGHSRGATVQHVNLKDIRALSIGKLPSLQDQAAWVRKTNALRDEINNADSVYEQKLNALGSLKQSLMNQAFSGNL